jgi:integrase
MATTTIHKRIQFARQFMHDAVDWKIIDENPFCKVKTQKGSVKVNEFVPREVVDKLMKKANPVWQVILGLSRYGGLRTPSETLSLRWDDIDWELNRMSIPEPKVEHHEGRGIRSCRSFLSCVPSTTKLLRSSATRATMWSQHRSTAPQPTRQRVGIMPTY